MKLSDLFSFLAGAAIATGVTLLITTEKGKEIRSDVAHKFSKEELDKMIAKLKRKRDEVADDEAAAAAEINVE